ncbi:ring-cleaving dioxygenase [Sutcliffiella cohnii]|uniref:Ring-cleaving dioxygenase n=1 Tax=Sutcliffiella cohnii TaxID=33932 RepID=A0A223KSU3_9BACI|nr:ring-cleaving dioxygenase [Sutcliffiella cohnii]AST92393.1 ring-cleaving dioxygenase [Sutcliffiella cohnii]MED4017141.1 ring-cleaving dioxygenase [Sutcliffiella cohnii]
MQFLGIHHVSLLTSNAEENYRFFTKVLGMRLVKKTVNQDNTQSYHLFYGDAKGNPGTEITFFDIAGLGRTYEGVSSISSTGLRVKDTEALMFWKKRFTEIGVKHEEIVKRAGRDSLLFQDSEGTKLILVADNGEKGVAPGVPWEREDIPSKYAIIGLGPVTLTVKEILPTAAILTNVMGFRHIGSYPSLKGDYAPIEVYATGEGGSGAEVHIEARPDLPRERPGRGSVHHVAFRIPNEEEYNRWVEKLKATRLPNSGRVDRYYFKAFYFREPNGILFELSTDTPGFDADEPIETLGEKLALPPFLESKRAEIEASLRPLELN